MRSLVVLFAVVAVAVAAPRLEKRSVGHAVAYSVPAAVSHQSRVDVHSSPAVVAETVVAEPVVAAYAAPAAVSYSAPAAVAYAAPSATVYAGGSAVSHQSRVDVHSSPAVVETVVAEPVLAARAVYPAPSVYAAPTVYAAPSVYAAPAAVSSQSRVDVHSSPAVLQSVAYPSVVEARSAWAPAVYSSW